MDKFEKMEELKIAMMRKVIYREGMPAEIYGIVKEAFEGVLNRYNNMACNNLSIQEYMQGNLEYIKFYINENLGEKRKEAQMEQVQDIVRRIEGNLEDIETLENDKNRQEGYREEINQIDSKNQEMTANIITAMEETLKDVQSRQNRILDSNGFSMDRIEQINQNVQDFIRYYVSRNQEKIYEVLEKDSDSLKEELLSEYEQYVLQNLSERRANEQQNEEEQEEKTKREEFIERLDAGISLEEQKDFSEKQTNELEKERKNEEQENSISSLDENVII